MKKNTIDTLIFDLFGVLFTFEAIPAIRYLGPLDMLWYCIRFQKNPFTQSLKILDKMRREVPHEYQDLMTYKGTYLPESFVNWQKGYLSRYEIVEKVHAYIHHLNKINYFKTEQQKRAIEKLILLFAHPSQLVDSFYPPAYNIELIKKLHEKGYKLFVLSNIDSETHGLITQKYASFFSLFNGFVASCNVHAIKPDPAIYKYLLNEYNLAPEHCYFFDDQKENVSEARHLKINAIRCPKPRKLPQIVSSIISS